LIFSNTPVRNHAPQIPSDESMKEYAHLDEQHQPYTAAIADGDKGFGRVLVALQELKLDDNTLVIFTSDNGPEKTGKETTKELRGGYGACHSVGITGGLRGPKVPKAEFIRRWCPRAVHRALARAVACWTSE